MATNGGQGTETAPDTANRVSLKNLTTNLGYIVDGKGDNEGKLLLGVKEFLQANGQAGFEIPGLHDGDVFMQSGASYKLAGAATKAIKEALNDGDVTDQDMKNIAAAIQKNIQPNSIVVDNPNTKDDKGYDKATQIRSAKKIADLGNQL